jgi:hypothetical protein
MRLTITHNDLGDRALDSDLFKKHFPAEAYRAKCKKEDDVIKSLSECNPASQGLPLWRNLSQLDAEMRTGTRAAGSHKKGW